MKSLSVESAVSHVRRVLDELISVEDLGMLVNDDAIDLEKLVNGFIQEAAVKIHQKADVLLLEGISVSSGSDYTVSVTNSVATISFLTDIIRIVSICASDSSVVVTQLIPEDSAEARKQLNQHVRGTSDDPRVVIAKKWKADHRPIVKYYTTSSSASFTIEIVPYPTLSGGSISVCPRLEYAVLNELAAMVLDSLSQHDKADRYRNIVNEYLSVR